MSWEEKKTPKYDIIVTVENVRLRIEYDVANMSPIDDEWDNVNSASDIHIRHIFHLDEDIKRLIRGSFMKNFITEKIFERHNQEQ